MPPQARPPAGYIVRQDARYGNGKVNAIVLPRLDRPGA